MGAQTNKYQKTISNYMPNVCDGLGHKNGPKSPKD